MGTLQDTLIINFGGAVLLASGRSFRCELDGIHLHPLNFNMGEGHPLAFDADGPLDDF